MSTLGDKLAVSSIFMRHIAGTGRAPFSPDCYLKRTYYSSRIPRLRLLPFSPRWNSGSEDSLPSHELAKDRKSFFLPHQGVLNGAKEKLCVMFNILLNDCLHVGPKLQSDIAYMLLGHRGHRLVPDTGTKIYTSRSPLWLKIINISKYIGPKVPRIFNGLKR